MGQTHADQKALRNAALGGDHLAMSAYADWLEERGDELAGFWRWAAENKVAPIPVKDVGLLKKSCKFLWCQRVESPTTASGHVPHPDWTGPGSVPRSLWKFVSCHSTNTHQTVRAAFARLELAYKMGGRKSLE